MCISYVTTLYNDGVGTVHSNTDLSKSINLVSTTYIHSSCEKQILLYMECSQPLWFDGT